MNVNIALFFHICGVLILFGSAALEITSLNRMRRISSAAVARSWASVNKPLEFTFPISVVILIASGLYMLHENADFKAAQPWALTVLVVLVALAVLGAAFNGRRMKEIWTALENAPDGPISSDIKERIHDPVLLTSIHAMSAAIIGAVLIMTVKPGLRDSIIIVAVSMILGAAGTQAMLRNSAAASLPEPAPAAADAE
jgi:uncharacterized membrane protein